MDALPDDPRSRRNGLKTATCVFWATLIVIATPAASRAADDQWQVGTTSSFSSGNYGTDTRTEVFHTPLMARRLFTNGDLTLAFPFTCIRGNGAVTLVGGSPVRKEASGNSGTPSDGTTRRSGGTTTTGRAGGSSGATRATSDSSLRPGTGAIAEAVTNCGMGDIVVRGRYYLLDERGWLPTVALRAQVKLPTAEADIGLGTGQHDEGVGFEVSRILGGGFMAMVDGGYTLIGKPVGATFINTWWYDVGVGQDLAQGVVNLSVFFEEYSTIVPGLANARDILAAVTVKTASGWRVQVSGEFGLSSGAPDHGITFGASRRF
jgi:Putative MetA-pathway of phenol degradation